MKLFFSPLELLTYLEDAGFKLKVRDGKLVGPKGLSPELVEAVKEEKDSLMALITYQCPRCNQAIRENFNTPHGLYIQCTTDPVHFALIIPKERGKPSFASCGGIKPTHCKECGALNDGEWKYCNACWLKFISEDMEQQKTGTAGD